MKLRFQLLLIVSMLALLQGCTQTGVPISQLGTPRFVPQSQPDSTVETGIGQDPNTGGMFLQWYGAVGAAGYRVYRTDSTDSKGSPTDFQSIGNVVSSPSLDDTTMVDVSVQAGIRYFYCLQAYAPDGSLSSRSDTVNYMLLARPSLTSPRLGETVTNAPIYFSWIDRTGGGYTVIRVKDITSIPSTPTWISQRFQIFHAYCTQEFNFDDRATGQLVSGHSYQWRVDRFDIDGTERPFEGSRSSWSTFTAQ